MIKNLLITIGTILKDLLHLILMIMKLALTALHKASIFLITHLTLKMALYAIALVTATYISFKIISFILRALSPFIHRHQSKFNFISRIFSPMINLIQKGLNFITNGIKKAFQSICNFLIFIRFRTFVAITTLVLFIVGIHFGQAMIAPAFAYCTLLYLAIILDKLFHRTPYELSSTEPQPTQATSLHNNRIDYDNISLESSTEDYVPENTSPVCDF